MKFKSRAFSIVDLVSIFLIMPFSVFLAKTNSKRKSNTKNIKKNNYYILN
ncbi:hypothetical protein LDK20_00380 [Fusobacterium nucleatum]